MGQNFIQTGGGSGGGSGTVNSGTAGQMTYYAGTGTTVSGTANATISSGALTLGVATSVQGQIILSGATSGAVTVTGAAAAGTWTLTLPTTGGTNGYFLQTNGSGTTTWATAGGTTVTTPFTTYSNANPGVVFSNANAAANQIAVFPFVLPYALTITNISFWLQTGGSTADIGIYNTSGTLLGHIGASAYTSGVKTQAISGGAITIGPGLFLIAVTQNNTTTQWYGPNSGGSPAALYIYDTATTSSAGVLPSTITLTNTTPTNSSLPSAFHWSASGTQNGVNFIFT